MYSHIYILTSLLSLGVVKCLQEQDAREGDVRGHCLGGPDPVCYFPPHPNDPEDLVDQNGLEEGHTSAALMNRAKREAGEKGRQNETEEGPQDLVHTTSQPHKKKTETEVGEEDDIQLLPLNNPNDMTEVYLKEYAPDTVIKSYYPPWTYQGFNSPKYWDSIPAHYFAPREAEKRTSMSKMLEGVQTPRQSGHSFMQFGLNGTKSNCSTDYPSPIDIRTDAAREEPSFVNFNMMYLDVRFGFILYLPEDGTDLLFVKLQTPLKQLSKKPSIDKGSVLGSPLTLDRILIHYGTDPQQGSEHRINGRSYGMELQFMFTLQTQGKELTYYDVLYEYAVSKDSSLFGKNQLALCVFVQVGPSEEKTPPPGKVYNKGMGYLAMAAREFGGIRNTGKYRAFQTSKKVLMLEDFFAIPFKGHYYTYFGSLTHPPCFNNTRYSVFEQPIYISHKTWRDFLFLPSEFSDTGFVADNFRRLEDINVWNNDSSLDNPEIRPYMSPEIQEKISYTVAKSRFATSADRMTEYDYTDENMTAKKSRTSSTYQLSAYHLYFVLISSLLTESGLL